LKIFDKIILLFFIVYLFSPIKIFAQGECDIQWLGEHVLPDFSHSCQGESVFLSNPSQCPENDPYILVFEDDFSGTSLDPTKWDTQFPWGKGMYGIAVAEPQNVSVDGELKITAIKPVPPIYEYSSCCCDDGSTDIINCIQNDGYANYRQYFFTSGMIYSRQAFQYGKFEIFCKIPSVDGVWPAFWLFGGDDGQEIDVFDGFRNKNLTESSDIGNKLIHYGWIKQKGETNESCCYGDKYSNGVDYHLAFHKYSIEWDEYTITWRIDDNITGQINRYYNSLGQGIGCANISSGIYTQTYFPTNPINIIINLQVKGFCDEFGSGCGGVDESRGSYPSTMEVKYIKVWKRDKGCCKESKLFESTENLPTNTQVEEYIKAGNDVGISGVSGNVTLKNGQNSTFSAGNYIDLKPGFSVEHGGNFTAKIQDCNPLTLSEGDDIIVNSIPDAFSPDGDGIDDELCVSVNGATSYSIRVNDKDPPYNTFYYAENIPINSDPVCVWDGECNYTGNCWFYHKCNRQREIHLDFYNCDKSLNQTKIIDVNCSNTKTVNQNQINAADSTNELLKNYDSSNYNLSVVPNPNNGNMQVAYKIPENSTCTFEIYSLIGEKLYSYSLSSGNNTLSISLSEIQQGIYFYRAIVDNKQIATDKIIVIK
jgi:beta-glucanase (GH16 family)